MLFPVVVLAGVFLLIAFRRIGGVNVQIWQAMLFGAALVLLAGGIAPYAALSSVNPDVMLFLFGMFVVGEALEESGYLAHLTYLCFRPARTVGGLVLLILFGGGLASALLMNDTIAIIGTPVVLFFARAHGISSKLLLLALAFSVTIGSVASPIGNPQNLLIALELNGSTDNAFLLFIRYLFIPTVVNLLITYLFLRLAFASEFRDKTLKHSPDSMKDPRMASICRLSLAVLLVLVALKIALVFLDVRFDFRLTYIALASALPVLLFAKDRVGLVRRIDWHTLIFFASMFVLMESVWESGFFQAQIAALSLDLTSAPMILAVSIVLSQLISNVPLVALYMPMLLGAGAGAKELVVLAAGSTIAGNLLILGAASNVIIVQNAERKSGASLSFLEFARIGIPLTIANAAVYWLFLL
jgi:Na+/H+ antiporter NhaD/arsenite permease-like protein